MGNQRVNLSGKCTGSKRITGLGTATRIPGVGNKVILQPEDQNVRVKYDGTPTADDGLLITTGSIVEIELGPEQSINDLWVIEVASSAELEVIPFQSF